MLGLTIDTVRQYERSGIVHPHKDQQNGYRYFSPHDVRRVGSCKLYRQMGFSLAEISNILDCSDVQLLPGCFTAKQQQLENEIKRIQVQQEAVQQHLDLIQQVPLLLHQYQRCHLPGLIRLPHSDEDYFSHEDHLTDLVKEWVELLPITWYTRRIPQLAAYRKQKFTYDMGLVIPQHQAHHLCQPYQDFVTAIAPATYIKTCIRKPDQEDFSYKHIQGAMRYLEKNNHTLQGDVLVYFICCEKIEGVYYNYHVIYLPI